MTDIIAFADGEYAFKYPTWACRVSTATSLDPPGAICSVAPILKANLSTDLKPVKVSRSAGGQQMDFAEFVWMTNAPLINRTVQPARFSRMIDVLFPTVATGFMAEYGGEVGWVNTTAPNRRVVLVDYTEEHESVETTELLTGLGEVRPYLFGIAFPGIKVSASSSSFTMTGTDAVFNPMIDGVVLANKSDIIEAGAHLWIDPEVSLTTYAQTFHGQVPSEWTLIEAINAICVACNADEWYIKNPVLDEGAAIFVDVPVVRDLKMSTGRYLPQYLDELLHPLGFNWFLDYDRDPTTSNDTTLEFPKPIIQIFRKGYDGYGDGTAPGVGILHFQAPGELLQVQDLGLNFHSNLNAYDIRRRIGDAVTGVRVLGDKLRAEVTIPLYPGWKAIKDPLSITDLAIDHGTLYAANKHVHRLWIGNEGADYYHMRTGADIYPIGAPPDFNAIFGICKGDNGTTDTQRFAAVSFKRRRMMEPPLTYQGTTTEHVRRDLLLQYSTDAGVTWIEITSKIGSWSVLGDQIGILFTDNEPPSEIVDAFPTGNLRMRITGTIASDHNLYNVNADKYTSGSVQGRLNLTTLSMADRFRHWFVVGASNPDRPELATSPYKSALAADVAGADIHDDRAAIIQFSEDIIKPMLNAEYDGNFVIPFWTVNYKIGMLLSEITGRNISLNQAAATYPEVHMQVTGIEYELSEEGGPQTRLIVDRGVREYIDPGYSRSSYADWARVFGGGANVASPANVEVAKVTLGGTSETSQSSW